MITFRLFFVALIGLLLSACAVGRFFDTQPQGYGAYPESYRSVVNAHLGEAVGQQDIVMWTEPEATFHPGEPAWTYGWGVCAVIAGPDGAMHPAYFVIRDDEIVMDYVADDDHASLASTMARQHCPLRVQAVLAANRPVAAASAIQGGARLGLAMEPAARQPVRN